jgi:hypothetical protein
LTDLLKPTYGFPVKNHFIFPVLKKKKRNQEYLEMGIGSQKSNPMVLICATGAVERTLDW